VIANDGGGSAVAQAGLRIRQALAISPNDLKRFRGVRVIADVHGAFDAFDSALREAEAENRYVIQLGDLIDRGPYSPFCVERMLEIEREGRGLMVPGNHEIAFARFVKSGENDAVTRRSTLMQFEEYGEGLIGRFISRIEEGPLWLQMGYSLFVHASFHPNMLVDSRERTIQADMVDIATRGEGTALDRRDPSKNQRWIGRIPMGMTVYVGHTVTKSGTVERIRGRRGGEAVFCDTGAWETSNPFPIIDLPIC
jgi:hypothetical protein